MEYLTPGNNVIPVPPTSERIAAHPSAPFLRQEMLVEIQRSNLEHVTRDVDVFLIRRDKWFVRQLKRREEDPIAERLQPVFKNVVTEMVSAESHTINFFQ